MREQRQCLSSPPFAGVPVELHGWDVGMFQVGTHVKRLGFVLRTSWNTEEFEVEEDMVEKSAG